MNWSDYKKKVTRGGDLLLLLAVLVLILVLVAVLVLILILVIHSLFLQYLSCGDLPLIQFAPKFRLYPLV